MARNPEDVFSSLRVGGPDAKAAPSVQAPQTQGDAPPRDVFAALRIPGSDGSPLPQIPRSDNTLGEEFVAGLGSGLDGIQGSLYGVAGLVGRETGIGWLEDVGQENAERNFKEAAQSGRQSQGFTDIESAGDFFKWSAASLGEAIPSLVLAMTGGGVGVAAGRKAVELGVKKSVARSVERNLRGRLGFSTAEALESTKSLMTTKQGKDMIRDAFLNGGRVIEPALRSATRVGAATGAFAASSLPQIGSIDQELISAGVADPGLTALLGGIAGGALEALPALRLMDKLFPGIDKAVSKAFVKDFAISTGTQAALEGGTEGAQEIIALAAMAYKDPTFDMFSPDARKRVIDAFAAGALVGAVTGGGAEGIGAVNRNLREGAKKAKAAVPVIGAWSMTVRDKAGNAIESTLPEGFTPADKTVFEEIRHRVYSSVQPHIEAAVNSLQGQMDRVTQSLNDNLEGGLNAEGAKVSDIARAAHAKFLEDHGEQIDKAKEFMDREIERITNTVRTINDPEERAKFIEDQAQAVKEKLSGFVDMIRRKAAERDERTTAEVDNMDFDDDMLQQMGLEIDEEGNVLSTAVEGDESGADPASTIQAEVGSVQAPPILIFGKNNLTPKVGVDGKESVEGFKDSETSTKEEQVAKSLETLRRRFPEAKDDSFEVKEQDDGTLIIEALDPGLRESQKFWSDFDSARDSALRRKDNPRKVRIEGVDGRRFGYKFKNLIIDVATMAFKGRNIDPNANTQMQGFLAMAGEMMSRGIIDQSQFSELEAAALDVFGEEANEAFDEFAAPPEFNTKGIATHVMINFKDSLAEKGIEVPFDLFGVRQNENGTWSFGYNPKKPQLKRAMVAKEPAKVKRINEELKQFRRDEQLDKANQDEGAFSGNVATGGPSTSPQTDVGGQRRLPLKSPNPDSSAGDLGDTRGDLAGTARVASDPTRTGRTSDGKRTEGIDVRSQTKTETSEDGPANPDSGPQGDFADTTGAFPDGDPRSNQRVDRKLEDTDPQADDRQTDPATKPKEFEDRGDPSVRNRTRRANQNARQLSKHDQRILARYGRPGSFKMMIGNKLPAAVKSSISAIGNFVTKTLGLSNQVTFVDDHGLQLMIDQGLVTDPIFEQTLNDPNVHARNIRINDNSFVYLSPKILADPAATVLAFSHEMGHHLYRVAWDKLTPEGQLKLFNAFQADTKKRGRYTKLESAEQKIDGAEFNEWMADQLAAWIARPIRKGGDPGKFFFQKVAQNIRKLYNFVANNKRFQLDETFKQFADAVALNARTTTSETANPFNSAILKTWFRNEGVTMYQWFGDAMQGKDQEAAPKKTKKAFEPHTIAERQDMAYRRQLEMEGLQEERDSAEDNSKRAKDLDKQIQSKAKEIGQIAEELDAQIGREQDQQSQKDTRKTGAEVDNIAYDFKPVTEEGKKALARMESKYPAIAKRAMTLRNWIVAAYKMAVAPSTSAVRDIGQRIKSANKLVTIFNREKQGDAKLAQNYHQAVELMRGQFTSKKQKITDGIAAQIKARRPGIKNSELQTLVNAKMREIGKSLSEKDGNPTATFTKEEQQVRDLFDDMHAYATQAGLPVRHVVNYFPRSFSKELLLANKQAILDHLTEGTGMPLAKARHLFNSLIDPHANDGRATFDVTETPGFQAMNSRQVQDKFFDQFLDDNTDGIVANYINQVVKRAEFNRKLGEPMPVTELDAKTAIKEGIWDPKAKMHKILADAKKEGATDEDLVILEKYIDANLGQLGRDDIKPGLRKFMAGIIAYQNLRVLMFTVFASLPDTMGPAIRSGSMKLAWGTLKDNIHELGKTDSDLSKMAHALGIVQDSISDHIMTEYVDNHYMPPKLQKWNQAFFKWTGLNYYTDLTRKYALAVGIDYIQQSYRDFQSPDSKVSARGKDMLAELGVKPAQVAKWLKNGKPTYDSQSHAMDGEERAMAEALVQFVDESIMRPNASQRPILASHPGAMLVYHLKNYMYSIHDIILKRIKFNIDESETPAQYAAAILPAVGMMLATAVGLELRELIQYAGSNRQPPTDRMDGWEYTWELAQRSGLTGFAQIGIDLEGAEDRGMSHVAGIGGPALSQAADIISKPSTQTIPKAIPIIGQIPALRNAVRELL